VLAADFAEIHRKLSYCRCFQSSEEKMTVGFVWEERELMLMDKLLKMKGNEHSPATSREMQAAVRQLLILSKNHRK
jgi:hypothetical protein